MFCTGKNHAAPRQAHGAARRQAAVLAERCGDGSPSRQRAQPQACASAALAAASSELCVCACVQETQGPPAVAARQLDSAKASWATARPPHEVGNKSCRARQFPLGYKQAAANVWALGEGQAGRGFAHARACAPAATVAGPRRNHGSGPRRRELWRQSRACPPRVGPARRRGEDEHGEVGRKSEPARPPRKRPRSRGRGLGDGPLPTQGWVNPGSPGRDRLPYVPKGLWRKAGSWSRSRNRSTPRLRRVAAWEGDRPRQGEAPLPGGASRLRWNDLPRHRPNRRRVSLVCRERQP